MKCVQCRNEMVSSDEDYRYNLSGLIYIVLSEIPVHRCSCGERTVSIPRIDELHRKIAMTLIFRYGGKLSFAETRFLKSYIDENYVHEPGSEPDVPNELRADVIFRYHETPKGGEWTIDLTTVSY